MPADVFRQVRAERGNRLRCKGWKQESLLRMLENNLENAEDPSRLIVYGGIAKAARNWESYHAIVDTLKNLEDDETLAIQAGMPVAVFRTHRLAPRVVMALSNVIQADWEKFYDLMDRNLTTFSSYTAGPVGVHRQPGRGGRDLRDPCLHCRQPVGRRPRRANLLHRGPRRHGPFPAPGHDHAWGRLGHCRGQEGRRGATSAGRLGRCRGRRPRVGHRTGPQGGRGQGTPFDRPLRQHGGRLRRGPLEGLVSRYRDGDVPVSRSPGRHSLRSLAGPRRRRSRAIPHDLPGVRPGVDQAHRGGHEPLPRPRLRSLRVRHLCPKGGLRCRHGPGRGLRLSGLCLRLLASPDLRTRQGPLSLDLHIGIDGGSRPAR